MNHPRCIAVPLNNEDGVSSKMPKMLHGTWVTYVLLKLKMIVKSMHIGLPFIKPPASHWHRSNKGGVWITSSVEHLLCHIVHDTSAFVSMLMETCKI